MTASVGIDIGGTFTDVVVCSDEGGAMTVVKVPTTPHDPGEGLITGLGRAIDAAGIAPSQVSRLVHGTTVGTNAILEHRGSRIGIITTAGFEDVLFIGRAKRADMYDLFIEASTPGFLCPQRCIYGVAGRAAPDGQVVDELDESAVAHAITNLVENEKVEAIAVCLLFSFANPAQEQRIEEMIRTRHPNVFVSLSSRIDPRFREFERLVVTAFDSYIRPLIGRYVRSLRGRLRNASVAAPLQVMESHGGIVASELVEERAVGTLLSGLAGGAIGAAATGTEEGYDNVIGFDMGGTSTDVTLIVEGQPLISDEGYIAGQPLRLPSVDVHTIGAGGGSIAYVDTAGSLRVGPHSAGADPGPVSYGRGGCEPTVTDANLVLGLLDEEGFAGGHLQLSRDLAEKALRSRIAEPLGMDVVTAAWGIHRLANAAMSAAVRVVSVGRGHDPRHSALVASGGAGPLHACSIADDLGINQILVPTRPGVLSAFGLLAADTRVSRWRTTTARVGEDDPQQLAAALDEVVQDASDEVARARTIARGTPSVDQAVDARYVGQSHELTVPVPSSVDPSDLFELITRDFNALHQRLYGQHDPSGQVEIAGVRATATVPHPTPRPRVQASGPHRGERSVFLPEEERIRSIPVVTRGTKIADLAGPAIIVQSDTTTLIRTGWTARQRHTGTLILSRDSHP